MFRLEGRCPRRDVLEALVAVGPVPPGTRRLGRLVRMLVALRGPVMLLAHRDPVDLAARLSVVTQRSGTAARFIRSGERDAGQVLNGPAELWPTKNRLGGPPPLAAGLLCGQEFVSTGASR